MYNIIDHNVLAKIYLTSRITSCTVLVGNIFCDYNVTTMLWNLLRRRKQDKILNTPLHPTRKTRIVVNIYQFIYRSSIMSFSVLNLFQITVEAPMDARVEFKKRKAID